MEQPAPWIAEGMHLAAVGPDLVILNLKAGAYYCIVGAADAVNLRQPGPATFHDEALAGQFVAAGLATFDPPPAKAPAPLFAPAPACDLLDQPKEVSAWDCADMARAYGLMGLRYCGRSLWSMVNSAKAGVRGARDEPPSSALRARAGAFQSLAPWLPLQGECLFRAFMLLTLLRLGGHDAYWIFAVRTWPFQAHCWLQAGGCVLDDAAEQVGAFTPILVV
jgi:hypothetical protein